MTRFLVALALVFGLFAVPSVSRAATQLFECECTCATGSPTFVALSPTTCACSNTLPTGLPGDTAICSCPGRDGTLCRAKLEIGDSSTKAGCVRYKPKAQ